MRQAEDGSSTVASFHSVMGSYRRDPYRHLAFLSDQETASLLWLKKELDGEALFVIDRLLTTQPSHQVANFLNYRLTDPSCPDWMTEAPVVFYLLQTWLQEKLVPRHTTYLAQTITDFSQQFLLDLSPLESSITDNIFKGGLFYAQEKIAVHQLQAEALEQELAYLGQEITLTQLSQVASSNNNKILEALGLETSKELRAGRWKQSISQWLYGYRKYGQGDNLSLDEAKTKMLVATERALSAI